MWAVPKILQRFDAEQREMDLCLALESFFPCEGWLHKLSQPAVAHRQTVLEASTTLPAVEECDLVFFDAAAGQRLSQQRVLPFEVDAARCVTFWYPRMK